MGAQHKSISNQQFPSRASQGKFGENTQKNYGILLTRVNDEFGD
jgi:hypothetical protein